MTELDVLSGGVASSEAAVRMVDIVANDLRLSGLFRVGFDQAGSDSLQFEFTIEGTVESFDRDTIAIRQTDGPTVVYRKSDIRFLEE